MKTSVPAQGSVKSEVIERPLLACADTAVFPGSRFNVCEVLQLIAFFRKTGTIRIWLPEETISIDIREGHVVDLSSDNSPRGTRLGEILVSQGALTREQLDSYLLRHAGTHQRIGRGLRRAGLINRKRICAALRRQLTLAVARSLAFGSVTVELVPLRNPYGSMDLWLDLNAVLLEAMASVDGHDVREAPPPERPRSMGEPAVRSPGGDQIPEQCRATPIGSGASVVHRREGGVTDPRNSERGDEATGP
jgi:hypothetical protein